METFYCKQTIQNKYNTQFFQYILKALQISSKVSLRIDGRGILCLQFLIFVEEDKASLVEYFFCPDDQLIDDGEKAPEDSDMCVVLE